MTKFPPNTPTHCNRCSAPGVAPKEFQAKQISATAWRIQDAFTHPGCGHFGAHWVYRVDLYHIDQVIQDALTLASGTIASMTNARGYEEIEEIQEQFCLFCCEHYLQFETWQAAWAAFRGSGA